ncbi:MAG: hypothetical protein OXF73_10935 [Gammaproteobacteria bacterium]|nr:hypothetical protein [Gammaproteobacteria bacterium]
MCSFQTGPFDKYLYSGAFYIQAASCYRPVLEWLSNEEPEQRETLMNLIRDSWYRSTVDAYSSAISGMGLVNLEASSSGPHEMARLNNILTIMVQKAVNGITERVSNYSHETLTLQAFFEIWIETCAKVHDDLINSEEFIDCITETINASLKTYAKGNADHGTMHE